MTTYNLKFLSGKYQGGEFTVPMQTTLIIGRSHEADLVLSEDLVSRRHAELKLDASGLSLTDLSSTNGTFINGERIQQAVLRSDDRILIGTSIIRVHQVEELAESSSEEDATRISGSFNKQALQHLMQNLGQRSTPTTTMTGDLTDVPLPDLLQLFATSKKSGILRLGRDIKAQLLIKDGILWDVIIDNASQMIPFKALCRLLHWHSGPFQFEAAHEKIMQPCAFEEFGSDVLFEAMKQNDETAKFKSSLPQHPQAKLILKIPMVPALTDLSSSELETLQAVINIAHIATLFDQHTQRDHEIATNLLKLLNDGFVCEAS